MLGQGGRVRHRLLLSRLYPTATTTRSHVIIAVPKITLAVITVGLGVSFLLSALMYVHSL